MGYTTEHRGRRPNVFVFGTGQFLNSTCIRTNQSSEGIRYIAVLTEKLADNVVIQEPLGRSDHNQLHFNIKIKSDKTNVGGILGKVTTVYKEIRKQIRTYRLE